MKIWNFVLFYEFIIFTANHLANADSFEEVKLTITPENDKSITAHLKRVESFLANENLPIWNIQNHMPFSPKLQKVNSKKVMQDLGPFIMYQDCDTSSAVVYFHKRNELDGTIDMRYIVKGLSISNNIYKKGKISKDRDHSVFKRQHWGHDTKSFTENKDWIFPNHFSEWIGKKLSIEHKSLADKPTRNHPDMFYIETLIVVNYDVAEHIQIEYGKGYDSLVSYLLTLFHSTDMLFSKIQSPKIKINIAGIIVGFERSSFPFLAKCYNHLWKYMTAKDKMDATCVNEQIINFLLTQKHIIPADSYDTVVFLTKHPLQVLVNDEQTKQYGFMHVSGSAFVLPEIYEYRKEDDQFKPSICIRDTEHFGSFTAVAHEMVHTIGVDDHDEQCTPKNGICTEKIMKEVDGFCQHCLDWSDRSKSLLQSLLRSPDGCIFRNEPRSLYPPGPRLMLTADEQCRCYNYESAYKHEKKCSTAIHDFPSEYCSTFAQCKDKNGVSHHVPVPMDGTPCDDNNEARKVCWNRKCTEIRNRV